LQLKAHHKTSREPLHPVHVTTIKRIVRVAKVPYSALVDVLFKGVGKLVLISCSM